MNILGTSIHRRHKLLSRNEGKIKSYESCSDVRAWSHDLQVRDSYLREWIKRDMPICVLPVCTLANFLRIMTCRSRARVTPRCHPDCKSKVLLESICSSCHTIKECLRNDPSFDKYFAEEEFETSHWPCDKCLEVLKSIKMFWKIIIEKIFGVNISKSEEFQSFQDIHKTNVKSVAKLWEKEMIQQALFVKNVTPLLSKSTDQNRTECPWRQATSHRDPIASIPRSCKIYSKDQAFSSRINNFKNSTNSTLSQRTRVSDTAKSNSSFDKNVDKHSRKLHRCTSIRVRLVDQACETCHLEQENEDLKTYRNNVNILQQKCIGQEAEIKKIKRENSSLKIELQNIYKSTSWRSILHSSTAHYYDKTTHVPKPFECIDDNTGESSVRNTDSEMIITMKNCKNESFRHVSVLQVLHKTNDPIESDENLNNSCTKKENPIDLLTKVQNKFGKIVRREIMLVKNNRYSTKQSDTDASFCSLKNSRSAPSYSTICSESLSYNSIVVADTK